MSSGLVSGDSKGRAWVGKDGNFVDQLIDLGLKGYLDHETEYDVSMHWQGRAWLRLFPSLYRTGIFPPPNNW